MISFAVCEDSPIIVKLKNNCDFAEESNPDDIGQNILLSGKIDSVSFSDTVLKIFLVNERGNLDHNIVYIGFSNSELVGLKELNSESHWSFIRQFFFSIPLLTIPSSKKIQLVSKKYLISSSLEFSSESEEISSDKFEAAVSKGSKIIIPTGSVLFYNKTRSCVTTTGDIQAIIEDVYVRKTSSENLGSSGISKRQTQKYNKNMCTFLIYFFFVLFAFFVFWYFCG